MPENSLIRAEDVATAIEQVVPGAGEVLRSNSFRLRDVVDSLSMIRVLLSIEDRLHIKIHCR